MFSMQYEELQNNKVIVSILNSINYETVQRMYLKNMLTDIGTRLQILYISKYLTHKQKIYIHHA
jgi:hypothetical protein